MKKKIFLFLCFSWALSTSISAQFYQATRYADDNGLPVRMVRGAMQDEAGFLWVAGNNGLFKYDGKKFHPFYSSLDDTTGLRGNKIFLTAQSSDKKIWVGTSNGLHYILNNSITYLPLSQNSDLDNNHILSIIEDDLKRLWIGTYNGIYFIEKNESGQYTVSNRYQEYIPKGAVWAITKDPHNNLWVTSSEKVFLISNEEIPRIKELFIDLRDELVEKRPQLFNFKQYRDSLYLIDSDLGLLKGILNRDTTMTVSMFKDYSGAQIGGNYVYHSIIDSEENIWIATYRNRIKKFALHNDQLEELPINITNGWQEMANHAISISEDVQKNIWVSNANGLHKLTKDESPIYNFSAGINQPCFDRFFSPSGAIAEDQFNNLWIGTFAGLYRIKKDDILNRHCPEDYYFNDDNLFKNSRDILIDNQNRLWLTSAKGLHITLLDKDNYPTKWVHYTRSNGLPHEDSYQLIHGDNDYWLANYSALVKINLVDNDINKAEFKIFQTDKERPESLVNSWTKVLQKDSKDNLWVGTYDGLSKLISKSGEGNFENFLNKKNDSGSISNNSIKNILNDRNGNLWVGTQGGLNLFRPIENDFLHFGRKDGLPSEYILGLKEDSKGNIWLATTLGIFSGKYMDSCKCFIDRQYYTLKDGLADNITNRNAFYIDKLDNVFIGSRAGLSVLPATTQQTLNNISKLALTRFESTRLNEQGFANIKDRIKEKIVSSRQKKVIQLAHFENSIQLEYALLDFSNTEFNSYRHKLLPVTAQWIETGNQSEVTYYNLSPGTYELILDGANNRNIWSKTPLHYKIIIAPPFYKSTLAYFLYSLLFAGALRWFYKWRVSKKLNAIRAKVKLEKALLNEKVSLRKENAADFHDELGSRVTKISLYLTLAERSLKEQGDPSNWFAKIRTNITDLSGIFRDLLWVIDPEKDSLSETFYRLKEFGESLFQNPEITFRTSGDFEDQQHIQLETQIKKQVVLIFKEAMNNCVKYAQAKKVSLHMTTSEKFAIIELKDDGNGFDVANRSNGRGLKNMKERAQKINAQLFIESDKNGTCIRLERIPHIGDDKEIELT